MEPPRVYKHLGNPPGKYSGGEYASKWGLFNQLPKAYKFIPLCNTGKKGNKYFSKEMMADTKSRTLPYSACQIYGKVSAKNPTPHFEKLLVAGNKTTKDFPKYGGNLHGKRDMCM